MTIILLMRSKKAKILTGTLCVLKNCDGKEKNPHLL